MKFILDFITGQCRSEVHSEEFHELSRTCFACSRLALKHYYTKQLRRTHKPLPLCGPMYSFSAPSPSKLVVSRSLLRCVRTIGSAQTEVQPGMDNHGPCVCHDHNHEPYVCRGVAHGAFMDADPVQTVLQAPERARGDVHRRDAAMRLGQGSSPSWNARGTPSSARETGGARRK